MEGDHLPTCSKQVVPLNLYIVCVAVSLRHHRTSVLCIWCHGVPCVKFLTFTPHHRHAQSQSLGFNWVTVTPSRSACRITKALNRPQYGTICPLGHERTLIIKYEHTFFSVRLSLFIDLRLGNTLYLPLKCPCRAGRIGWNYWLASVWACKQGLKEGWRGWNVANSVRMRSLPYIRIESLSCRHTQCHVTP